MIAAPTNQAERVPEHNAFEVDASMQWWLDAYEVPRGTNADAGFAAALGDIGREVGGWHCQDMADRANRLTPQLATFTRTGERIDEIAFDPSYTDLLKLVALHRTIAGLPGVGWHRELTRTAAFELWGRLDIGVMCPVSMTSAGLRVLNRWLGRDHDWGRRIETTSDVWDFEREGPFLVGMAMTEPQGGSDLSHSSTRAVEQDDGSFDLYGHKWFCSHPVSDLLLVLAREEGTDGLSCFAVPGWRADGSRNGIRILRLKDKLGTKSLASAEIEFDGARGDRIGPAGAGVRVIIEMVNGTRLDCASGGCGVMTRAVVEAVDHCTQRSAFGAPLAGQPAMRMVLADLALEREAALAVTLAAANAVDVDVRDRAERWAAAHPGEPHPDASFDPILDTPGALARVLTILGKFWVARRSVAVAIEACECLGGNGYTEDWVLARLYRDAQVNATWEGSGNVIALDLMRALASGRGRTSANDRASASSSRASASSDHSSVGTDNMASSAGAAIAGHDASPVFTALREYIVSRLSVGEVGAQLSPAILDLVRVDDLEQATARLVITRLAIALQAALLAWRADTSIDANDAAIARAFVATRIAHAGDRPFGAAGAELEHAADALISRYRVRS